METLTTLIFSLLGVLTLFIILAIIVKYSKKKNVSGVPMRQSAMFSLMKAMLPEDYDLKFYADTQSFSYEDSKSLKYVQMPDDKVYWLDKNRIYYANLGVDGKFDPDSGKLAAMKNLPEKEVAKVLYIYNTLKSEQI